MKKIKSMLAAVALLAVVCFSTQKIQATESCALTVTLDSQSYFDAGGTATVITRNGNYAITDPSSINMGTYDQLLLVPGPSWQCQNGLVVGHLAFWHCGKNDSPSPLYLPNCLVVTFESVIVCNCPFPSYYTFHVINQTPCNTGGQ